MIKLYFEEFHDLELLEKGSKSHIITRKLIWRENEIGR